MCQVHEEEGLLQSTWRRKHLCSGKAAELEQVTFAVQAASSPNNAGKRQRKVRGSGWQAGNGTQPGRLLKLEEAP